MEDPLSMVFSTSLMGSSREESRCIKLSCHLDYLVSFVTLNMFHDVTLFT